MYKSPQYLAPQPKSKRKQLSIVLAVFLTIGLIVFVIFYQHFYNQEQLVSDLPTICGYNTDKTKEILKEINLDKTDTVSDYFYYGETLSVFDNQYVLGTRDPFMGQQIRLENLCDSTIVSFLLTPNLDSNIPVEELDEGFYVMSLEQGLETSVLIGEQPVLDTLYTVSRNGQNKKVEIIADDEYFVDTVFDEKVFDQPVVFIQVSHVTAPENIVDIVLDPAHMDQDFGTLDEGVITETFNEPERLYDLTLAIKEKLEEAGLRVEVTRERNEVLNDYGNPGRVYRAFDHHAKLMVSLDMVPSSPGFHVQSTSYGTLAFGEMVAASLISETSLDVYRLSSYRGAFYSSRIEGLDRQNLVRESGGYALGAATYSQISSRLNQFAKEERHGIMTLAIDYGDVRDELFLEKFNEEFENIANATAEGILNYLNIRS